MQFESLRVNNPLSARRIFWAEEGDALKSLKNNRKFGNVSAMAAKEGQT
jgi:hypothetical protein